MNYLDIKIAVLGVFKDKDICSFPIDCFKLLESCNLKVKSYSSQTLKKKQGCLVTSNDAFTLKRTVFYNDMMPNGRIRFSLMHELGHHILKHKEPRVKEHENEANYFASHILAPRMAIHYSQCKNLNDVSKIFELTHEAANYAFQDYRRWHRRAVYKMDPFDKAMYSHFYDEEQEKFIFSIKQCAKCGATIYNDSNDICTTCNKSIPNLSYYYSDIIDSDFLIAENSWLYGWL